VAGGFRSFVILGEMRTGSNFLEMNMNRLQGFTCYGEVFNPSLLGDHKRTDIFGMTIEQRNADPLALLAMMKSQTVGLSGFRFFHDHDPRILDAVMADKTCAKIILTRNPVESFISWKIAAETRQWRMMNAAKRMTIRPVFNAPEFERYLENLQDFQLFLLHSLQTSGQTAFYIDYEDIMDLDVLNGLAAFLGLEDRLKNIDSTLKKQNPEAIEAKVANAAEMAAALSRMDRFNLARTPNFEPRRNAGVPNHLASDVLPLIFMPIAGAPWRQISDWMQSYGGLTSAFERKSLRLWKEARPNHRSFTVLRHPLARAHTMFCAFLNNNLQPELRPYLAKFHGLKLPAQGTPFASDAEFRTAFLEFLKFLKRNLTGQTGLKVVVQFASQTAVIQGFSALYPPDFILRESDIAAGLAQIVQGFGAAFNPVANVNDTAPEYPTLSAIYDAELEQAARAAYDKDYMGFGFGNWR
jgi:LPS sulfotransferase NodH